MFAGSNNVYADLDFSNSAAMLTKAELVTKFRCLVRGRRVTRPQLAKLFRMSPSKVSSILRGNFRGISIDRLERCHGKLVKLQCYVD